MTQTQEQHRDDVDQLWLDENVTTYKAGSIPVTLTARQAEREVLGELADDCFCDGYEWDAFTEKYGEQKNYRARLLFEWLGY